MLWQPRMEIYLDVSGSMPNPCVTLNAMTLAAQILAVGTIRAGGWVRALMYSESTLAHWMWSRSETEISRFLMNYIGAGTSFPFEMLEQSLAGETRARPIRVLITDSDFDDNYASKPVNARIFRDAVAGSAQLILLLHQPKQKFARFYKSEGAKVVAVDVMANYPKMAADLTFALFPEG